MDTILDIKNLTVCFQNQIILEDINLTVHERDLVGITGPNGGGKTTLLKCILGLVKPQKGEVSFPRTLSIGYLPQSNLLDRQFPINVKETVLSGLTTNHPTIKGRKEDELKAQKIMERMNLWDLRDKPIGQLSGGQLQRTLLSRALIMDPELLILDEPSTYLDEQGKLHLRDLILEANKHCAVMVVSHEKEALSLLTSNLIEVNRHLRTLSP